MTPEQLNEIEQRAKAATEGPWVVTTCRCEHSGLKPSEHGVLATKTSGMLADFCESLNDENDAEFIASARADVPQLVAEVRRLQGQIAAVKEALSRHPKCDRYEESEVITCGWKSAVHTITYALEEETDE